MKKLILILLIAVFPVFLCGFSYEEDFINSQAEFIEESKISDNLSDETE